MKNTLLFVTLALGLAACAPATTQKGAAPNLYEATPEQVYNDVLAVIASDPGVPEYGRPFNPFGENMKRIPTGPWIIKNSDRAGGFITAEASSTLVTTFGSDSGQRETHSLSVVISGQNTPPRTQIVIQGTERAAYMATKINAALASKYKSMP